jgi:uncharacterized protein (DUF362 family)
VASPVIGTFQSQKFREFKRDLNLTICVIFAMHATEFTGSIKLAIGFVKPIPDQIMFHMKHLQEKLAELSLVVKPDLIIMDARKVFIKSRAYF